MKLSNLKISFHISSAVLAMTDSVRLSVTVRYHVQMTEATIMRSSLEIAP